MILGIGAANCIAVPTDLSGRLQVHALESLILQAKSEGKTPFFVSCTAGTTVTGSFDPLRAVADLCHRHGAWAHADGAWGGAVVFSEKHRALTDGLEDCDSFCFNPHKLMGVSSQCTMLLLNTFEDGHCRPGALQRSNDTLADYLFHSSTQNDADDLGHKSLQCGRKPDCLKLWLHWKRHGSRGIEQRIDRAFSFAHRLSQLVATDERFHLLLPPESCNVCFYYLPPSLRPRIAAAGASGVASVEVARERLGHVFAELDAATQTIYRRMQVKGSMLVNYSPLPEHGLASFFRPVIIQAKVMEEDLAFMLDEIDRLGADL